MKPYLKTVGLYNTKAKNLIGLAQQIIDQHGGEVPNSREALEALPGVGRKTASIILNMVFGQNEIAVDTHIFRVANRTGLAPGKTPRAVEDGLVAVTPKEYIKDAHHWLLLHGRYVCVARVPACPKCIIADLCEYPDKTPAKKLDKADAPVGAARWAAAAGSESEKVGSCVPAVADASRGLTAITLSRGRGRTGQHCRPPQTQTPCGRQADLTWPSSPDKIAINCVACIWTRGASTRAAHRWSHSRPRSRR